MEISSDKGIETKNTYGQTSMLKKSISRFFREEFQVRFQLANQSTNKENKAFCNCCEIKLYHTKYSLSDNEKIWKHLQNNK